MSGRVEWVGMLRRYVVEKQIGAAVAGCNVVGSLGILGAFIASMAATGGDPQNVALCFIAAALSLIAAALAFGLLLTALLRK